MKIQNKYRRDEVIKTLTTAISCVCDGLENLAIGISVWPNGSILNICNWVFDLRRVIINLALYNLTKLWTVL